MTVPMSWSRHRASMARDRFASSGIRCCPLSRTKHGGAVRVLFILGWNQYLWPLLITTRDDMQTIVIGIKKMIVTSDALTEWQLVMATAMLAMLPPVAVVVLMQRLFVRGLVETEK